MSKLKNILTDRRLLLAVYILVAIIVCLQLISRGTHPPTPANEGDANFSNDIIYTHENYAGFAQKDYTSYNNYVIFKYSHFHLLAGQDLYKTYPEEHWDFYKYSPTFAVFMGVMAYFPDTVGLAMWNLLNVLVLFIAIRRLPIKDVHKSLLLWFVLVEMVTSLQSAQSNTLIAGLMILAFTHLHCGKPMWAALWLVAASFIKIYGAAGFILFLFYPQKIRFILYSMLWTILFLAIPLAVTPYHILVEQYESWYRLLTADQATSYGLSVTGWLHRWFATGDTVKLPVMLIGIIGFFAPLARYKLYTNDVYRMSYLGAMLVWLIIFNHKAESPTFIIAVAGVGLWYFAQPGMGWKMALLWLVLIGTSLTPTDLFPSSFRKGVLVPYAVKVIPCIVVWVAATIQLMTMKQAENAKTGDMN